MQNNPYPIEYLPLFEEDLNEIINYILFRLQNKSAALKLVHNIEYAITKRAYNPTSFETFKSAKYRQNAYYKIHVNNFTIYYIVKNNIMEVRRILYNKRNLDNLIDL